VADGAAGDEHDTIRLTADIALDADPTPVTSQITVEGGSYSISGDGALSVLIRVAPLSTLTRMLRQSASAMDRISIDFLENPVLNPQAQGPRIIAYLAERIPRDFSVQSSSSAPICQ